MDHSTLEKIAKFIYQNVGFYNCVDRVTGKAVEVKKRFSNIEELYAELTRIEVNKGYTISGINVSVFKKYLVKNFEIAARNKACTTTIKQNNIFGGVDTIQIKGNKQKVINAA